MSVGQKKYEELIITPVKYARTGFSLFSNMILPFRYLLLKLSFILNETPVKSF